ncbi:hypothetical protein MP228_001915 [Amoeboaphelidium protococcarum]|nr:hypothetical protein MP228_001915 [Amoeboaphelidium protococcarum]
MSSTQAVGDIDTYSVKQSEGQEDSRPTCPHRHNTSGLADLAHTAAPQTRPCSSESARDIESISEMETQNGQGGPALPDRRMTSSIPKSKDGENWVYPSQKQFYSAMKKKNYNPDEQDMSTIVPIHNLINELAWTKILQWEKEYASTCKSGPVLKKFMGRPDDPSPRAMFNTYFSSMGRPFDRHDWVIDRCGKEVTYILDFYNRPTEAQDQVPFKIFVDVRPSLWSLDGAYQRFKKFWFK